MSYHILYTICVRTEKDMDMLIENTRLKDYFPMLRSREEVLAYIQSTPAVSDIFFRWSVQKQEAFLDFASAVKGLKPLYDSFFKELFNAETVPERLEELLSFLLEQKVRIQSVLPNDNTRIAAENTLLITDIVVQLEDGSLANVEIQKRGYDFPGQRSACYSADLLLRQYKRIRSEKGKEFTYRDIRDVYCIVIYERSPKEFSEFPDIYIHRSRQVSDSGLEQDLLQKYIFIPLDIFSAVYHNKGIRSKLDAWLVFLSQDNPKDVLDLIEQYPEFKSMYEQLYQICRSVEGMMGIFSDELRILDENTVRYMIDERDRRLEEAEKEVKEANQKVEAAEQKAEEAKQKVEAAEQKAEEAKQKVEAAEQKAEAAKREMAAVKRSVDDLNASVLKAVSEGSISFEAGREVLHLPDAESLRQQLKKAGLPVPG